MSFNSSGNGVRTLNLPVVDAAVGIKRDISFLRTS
jgi:hypothetical protein